MRSRDTGVLTALALALASALLFPMVMGVQAQDESANPADVVQAVQDARNSGDAVSAAALFADNAILVRPPARGTCSRQSPCIGRAAILAQFQTDVANHFCLTTIERTVSGSVVTSRSEVSNDGIRASGIERVRVVSITLVDQGKVVANYAVSDLDDPQTAANAAIAAGLQAPGAPIPNPATPCG